MDELVKLVSVKTGLSEEMSKVAVETVISHLKDKLPAPLASQVDAALGGGGAAGGIANMAKGLFD
ncbi:MAG TPA: hypothetical protein P5526_11275 [Anaerolineae bacterium]|nr:hypothetical protein [Anaerolineae bacterium]MCB9107649.1 hypothetical protein [Anaerolineales bacterium]HRV92735.1 hypothetical protein [Anaerolineae bacterium]